MNNTGIFRTRPALGDIHLIPNPKPLRIIVKTLETVTPNTYRSNTYRHAARTILSADLSISPSEYLSRMDIYVGEWLIHSTPFGIGLGHWLYIPPDYEEDEN